jgi:hypothetical protein
MLELERKYKVKNTPPDSLEWWPGGRPNAIGITALVASGVPSSHHEDLTIYLL